MGTAAAWALAKRGVKTLVLEQFAHVHDLGSHGGETRIIRHAYAESPEYVPLVLEADRLWQELEAVSGRQILVRSGSIELAAAGHTHARDARASAEEHDLPFEWLSPVEVSARWPAFRVPADWEALYSPGGGFLLTEPALRSMAAAASDLGATFLAETPATAWGAGSNEVWVEADGVRHEAGSLIVTAGAWTTHLLSDLGLPIRVLRKTLWWQAVDDPALFSPERVPVFISESRFGEIYGFPIFGTPGLKIANHAGGEPADPRTVERNTRPGENRDCLKLAAELIPAVKPNVVKSAVCLYSMTPDADFIIDRHPDTPRVAFGAGFSGHGFKFAPAVGELLADLVTNPQAKPMARVGLARFEKSGTLSGASA
jgi:monomeric sarcosine oxidase